MIPERKTPDKILYENGIFGNEFFDITPVHTAMQQYADQENKAIHDKLQQQLNQGVKYYERIKEIEDGLRELLKWCDPDDRWNYMAAIERAEQLLTK